LKKESNLEIFLPSFLCGAHSIIIPSSPETKKENEVIPLTKRKTIAKITPFLSTVL